MIVSRSRASPGSAPHPQTGSPSSRLRVMGGAGRAVPTPPIPGRHIPTTRHHALVLCSCDNQGGYKKCCNFLPIFPAAAPLPHDGGVTTIHPRPVLSLCGRVRPGTHWPPRLSAASRLSQLSRKRTAARYRPGPCQGEHSNNTG